MIWIPTASGQALDLLDPDPATIRIEDIAEHLAKCARYAGATPEAFYSVAQHSAHAAGRAFALTGDATIAAYALLHDAHEYAIGDDSTPKKAAIVERTREIYGEPIAAALEAVYSLMRFRLDLAIHAAVGLPFPAPATTQALIKRIDKQLLETERRDLRIPAPRPWQPSGEQAIVDWHPIVPWGWRMARNVFLSCARRFLPAIAEAAAE